MKVLSAMMDAWVFELHIFNTFEMSSNPFAENKVKDQSFRFDRRIINNRRLNPPPVLSFNDGVSHAIGQIERTLINLQTEHERLKSELSRIKSSLVTDEYAVEGRAVRESIPLASVAMDQLTEMSTSVNELCSKYDTLSTDVESIRDTMNGTSTLNDVSKDVVSIKAEILKIEETLSEQALNYDTRMCKITDDIKLTNEYLTGCDERMSELETTVENTVGNVMKSEEIQKYIDRLMNVEDSIPYLTATTSKTDVTLSGVKAQLEETGSFVDSVKTTLNTRVNECSEMLSNVETRVLTCETVLSSLREETGLKMGEHETEMKSLNECMIANDAFARDAIDALKEELGEMKSQKQHDMAVQMHTSNEHFDRLDGKIDELGLRCSTLESEFTMSELKTREHSDNITEILKMLDEWEKESGKFGDRIDDVKEELEKKVEELRAEGDVRSEKLTEVLEKCVKKSDYDASTEELTDGLNELSAKMETELQTFAKREDVDVLTEGLNEKLTDLSTSMSNQMQTFAKRSFLDALTDRMTNGLTDITNQMQTFAKQVSLDELDNRLRKDLADLLTECSTFAKQTALEAADDRLTKELTNISTNLDTQLPTFAKQVSLGEVSDRLMKLSALVNKHLEAPHPYDVIVSENVTFGFPTDEISKYHIGMPVYMTADGFVYDSIKKEFTHVNDVVRSGSFQSLSNPDVTQVSNMFIYPNLSTSGTWKEYVGVCTSVDEDLNIIRYSNSGTYMVADIPDTSNLGIGETLFIDPDGKIKILADNATVTTKMRRMILGTIIAIINDHIVQVYK